MKRKTRKSKNKEISRFGQGFACACACIIKSHGRDTSVDEAILSCFKSVADMIDSGVPDHDIEVLAPIFHEHDSKLKRQNKILKKCQKIIKRKI